MQFKKISLVLCLAAFSFNVQADWVNNSTKLTASDAKEIAINAARGGRVVDIELERRKGSAYYEVEVKNQGVEHEIKIDATTGRILKHKTENKTAQLNISRDQAKQIALTAVRGGRITDIDLENKRAAAYYEVEVRDARGNEHELKIDAQSGKVFSHKIDD
ncbi:MAG: PepSY domain-containing protein [Cardiobacteriaceae bacterium]|nr:PepSY domain-containing protein [Cardiobacteriaceae bacterium]